MYMSVDYKNVIVSGKRTSFACTKKGLKIHPGHYIPVIGYNIIQ